MTTTTKIFGTSDIRRLAGAVGVDAMMDDLIERLDVAFASYDPSIVDVPVRSGFHYDVPRPGLIEWMPVMAHGHHALMKLVCYHPENPARSSLPTILSTFSLIDTATGRMLALSDGTFLTALRTGAASAVATRTLAKSGSVAVGMIGCGAQAVTQLHAVSRVRPIELVLFWDNDPETCRSAPARFSAVLPAGVRLLETPIELIVPNVDVLCTATSIPVGSGPLFDECVTRPDLHINAVGSDFPGKVEIPRSLLSRSTVIPDFAEQAVAEGECQQLDAERIGPELYRVIQDGSGERLRGTRTVFDSTGWALEDLVAMEALVHWGDQLGLGADFEIESIPGDPKNPYLFGPGAAGTGDIRKHGQG